MNPPLNCGAKIATKIESANFSVKKSAFFCKNRPPGGFRGAGARLLPLPHRAPSDTARDCGQARVDKRRWTASGWTGAGLLSFAGPRRAPSSPTGHRGAPPPIRQPEHTGAHRRLPRRTHRPPGHASFHCPIAPVTAPVTLPPGRRFRGRRLHYRPSCLIFDFRKLQNGASRENTFPR